MTRFLFCQLTTCESLVQRQMWYTLIQIDATVASENICVPGSSYSCSCSPKVHTGSTTWSACPPVVVPDWGSSEGTPLLSHQHPIHWYPLTSIISPQMNWLQRALSEGLHFGASNLQVCWVWQAAGLPFKSVQFMGANALPLPSYFHMVVGQMALPIAHGRCHMASAPTGGLAKVAEGP